MSQERNAVPCHGVSCTPHRSLPGRGIACSARILGVSALSRRQRTRPSVLFGFLEVFCSVALRFVAKLYTTRVLFIRIITTHYHYFHYKKNQCSITAARRTQKRFAVACCGISRNKSRSKFLRALGFFCLRPLFQHVTAQHRYRATGFRVNTNPPTANDSLKSFLWLLADIVPSHHRRRFT